MRTLADELPVRTQPVVPDAVYESVRARLSESEISDLSFLIIGINGWNRLNVAFRTVPGSADKAYGLDKAGLS